MAGLAILTLATEGTAQDTAAATAALGLPPLPGILVTTSISLNIPLAALGPEERQAEEDRYRRGFYERATGECAILLETVAKSCEVTSLNISTQINSSPGQPDYLYATANITMQVELN
jgi:hypothetical protein